MINKDWKELKKDCKKMRKLIQKILYITCIIVFLFVLLKYLTSCNKPVDPEKIRPTVYGMAIGNDTLELGGTIFYIDTINQYCLLAYIGEEAVFLEDCQYPTWCPYKRIGRVEIFKFIKGLTDTIGGGKINTQILFNEYGCNALSDYYNAGFYGALCAYNFKLLYDDYWQANLREALLYANTIGGSGWYSTSTQVDTNNYYTINCLDRRIIIEPKSQKREPLIIRKHNFN